MGSSSKAKANKAGVASKSRAVLGGSRTVKQRAASSARSKAKAKTKTKAKASKAKSKVEVYTVEENVAKPSYYPHDMMDFIVHQELSFLEGSILKRLVRLENKDKPSDLKKLKEEFFWFFPKIRTQKQVVQLSTQWAVLRTNHEYRVAEQIKKKAESLGVQEYELWEERVSREINYYADKFIEILCEEDRDTLWLKIRELNQLLDQELDK